MEKGMMHNEKKPTKKMKLFRFKPSGKSIFVVCCYFLNSTVVVLRNALLFLVIAGCSTQRQATLQTEPLAGQLRTHVEYLSGDQLEGRRTGTEGERLASEYISAAFAKAGLQPKGSNGFFQAFSIDEGREIAPSTVFSINGNALTLNRDFFPLVFSANGKINSSPSIALMESGEPWFYNIADVLNQNKPNPHFDITAAVLAKAKEAAQKGATALLVYNTSVIADGWKFNGREKAEVLSIPVVYFSNKVAATYFKDLTAAVRLEGTIEIREKARTGRNVVGYIDNGAATTIVLGAHFDHLGYGEDQNSRHTGSDKQIHNGADDNASGTAALLELARLVKASDLKKNNYLFIAFSGEELGLYGSKYFTQNPTIDLSTVNYMINMDMVGRLSDTSKTLTVGGYGTSPVWGELYNRQGKEGLYPAATYRFDSSGTGPSDHTSFYLKDIPVLFYFTGLHTDYHKPSDDFDKINYNGEAAIVQHIFSLLQATDKLPAKVAFTKTREAQTATTARFSVTLGIMPDYTYNGAGVRADGVTEGRPAQKAGLKTGDVITSIGDYKIGSMESYMQALGKFKKGDKATVNYIRDGKSLVTTVEF